MASLFGFLFGLAAVHITAFTMALNDKAAHLGRTGAMWQAVFYDFMIGIPVAALCGWAAASLLKRSSKA